MQRVLSWSESTIMTKTSLLNGATASGQGRCYINVKYNKLVILNSTD